MTLLLLATSPSRTCMRTNCGTKSPVYQKYDEPTQKPRGCRILFFANFPSRSRTGYLSTSLLKYWPWVHFYEINPTRVSFNNCTTTLPLFYEQTNINPASSRITAFRLVREQQHRKLRHATHFRTRFRCDHSTRPSNLRRSSLRRHHNFRRANVNAAAPHRHPLQ